MSSFVSVLQVCFTFLMDWFLQFVGLYNTYPILMAVIALIVLGLVVDLFQYIISRK